MASLPPGRVARDSCDADIKCKEYSHSEATAARN